ncbi:15-hydroxyprostaglandin dehydrogenase [NAD(+)] [Manduca sexta]|uniref:15-hydroxyprostaglandin dehydrogenase [NAD(+)] n=1 Tax=Manduca sexta TaxID=7130 RepID=UPI00188F54DF|nr:15-hydroxyprostaglandin dehydrogenase [NAD(+)] [Manduca sexta]
MRILTAVTLVLSAIFAHADDSFERSLEGKYIAVTGGAGEICSAIAKKFLEHGARFVILIDYNNEKGEEVKNRLNNEFGDGMVEFIHADVTKDLKKVVEQDVPKYGLADVLVNCAGILNEYDARSVMETNAVATIEWSDVMYELSRADKGGKGSTIINMSDMYAYNVDGYVPIYTAASAATTAYTKAKGHQMNYRHSKVRMFSIHPGFTETPMTAGQMEIAEKNDDFVKYSKSWAWQTSDEVADALMGLFPVAESGAAYTIDAGKYYESPALVYRSVEYIDNILQQ